MIFPIPYIFEYPSERKFYHQNASTVLVRINKTNDYQAIVPYFVQGFISGQE